MKYEKYVEYLNQFPLLPLWLEVPTFPDAEKYLGKEKAREFREVSTRNYVEDCIRHIAVVDVNIRDLLRLEFKPLVVKRNDEDGFSEYHQLVFYHLTGEQPFSRIFAYGLYTDKSELRSLSDVAAEIESTHPDEDIVLDGCLVHFFDTGRRSGRRWSRGLTISKFVE